MLWSWMDGWMDGLALVWECLPRLFLVFFPFFFSFFFSFFFFVASGCSLEKGSLAVRTDGLIRGGHVATSLVGGFVGS